MADRVVLGCRAPLKRVLGLIQGKFMQVTRCTANIQKRSDLWSHSGERITVASGSEAGEEPCASPTMGKRRFRVDPHENYMAVSINWGSFAWVAF